MSAFAYELMLFARRTSMCGQGGFVIGMNPVQLTADDCMDAGGRATHGAVAEASLKMDKAASSRHFSYEAEGTRKGCQMPGALSCFFFGHAKKKGCFGSI